VKPVKAYGKSSTTEHATLAGQQEKLLGPGEWWRTTSSNFNVSRDVLRTAAWIL